MMVRRTVALRREAVLSREFSRLSGCKRSPVTVAGERGPERTSISIYQRFAQPSERSTCITPDTLFPQSHRPTIRLIGHG